MRLGLFKDGKSTLEKGQNLILTSRDIEGKMGICSINHKNLLQEVKAGDQLLLSGVRS